MQQDIVEKSIGKWRERQCYYDYLDGEVKNNILLNDKADGKNWLMKQFGRKDYADKENIEVKPVI